ncbi:rod shape-determining protein MreD (plasmid) [Bacillus sp. 31A1R]|uniref:Rod shape-determining protein MreD n=1 Tax=Robertmurraya mangrovi TaxID=3098077 RepID=A0ABU5IUK3_9BACI|nr:rod shape-determining protein MreD [Bacillus sp. 31A1R]MDZ5470818.1 rod shape-determining protein MreD [Bacillus sp. 31A1R]
MRKFLLPTIFLILFIIESIFVELLPAELFNSANILVPRFLIIAILFLTIYGIRNQGIIYAFIFGLLFDIVYTEIIGIYLFMFPLVAYIVSKIMKVFHSHIVIVTVVSLIGVALLELSVYEIIYLIKLTTMDFTSFLQLRLLPTIILNLAFAIIFAYPLKRTFEKYTAAITNE